MKEWFVTWFCRAFGIGLSPVSPGTFGSVPGLAVGCALYSFLRDPYLVGTALALFTGLCLWAIHEYEKLLAVHDDQRVVIDEVLGMAIGVAFVPPTALNYLVGFALFRLLDIAKPPPIGTIDRKVPGAAGTLFDDVLAGIVAAAILFAFSRFVGGFPSHNP